jgi:hypothetical protein
MLRQYYHENEVFSLGNDLRRCAVSTLQPAGTEQTLFIKLRVPFTQGLGDGDKKKLKMIVDLRSCTARFSSCLHSLMPLGDALAATATSL